MTVQGFLDPLLAAHPLLVYPATYFSIILIGNPASFAALWLAFEDHLRASSMFGILGLILFADISGDLAWYSLGRSLRDTRIGRLIHSHIPRRNAIEKHVAKNASKWIFLSKFIPSSTFAIIFSVGWAKVKFRKFLPVSLAAIGSSVAVLALIAYALASSLSSINAPVIFRRIEHLLAISLVIFIGLNIIIARFSRNLMKEE